MVELQIHESDIGLVVRLLTRVYSASLQRDYLRTDLITVVKAEYEAALRADFDIYRHFDESERLKWIEYLKMNAYVGRMFSESDIPASARNEPAVNMPEEIAPNDADEQSLPQRALF